MLSNVVAAIMTGIDNKREYLEESKRLKPINNPADMTMPDPVSYTHLTLPTISDV